MDNTSIAILVSTIISFASILTAIGAIWTFSSRVKKTFKDSVNVVIKEALEQYDEKINAKIDASMLKVQTGISKDMCLMANRLEIFTGSQNDRNVLTDDSIKLLKDSLVEAYKRDIRGIYYILRDTGEISDHDKSYVDKVYPKYKALGGNSDVEAKYKEICDIYGMITKENFEKARVKKRSYKKKVVDTAEEEPANEV